jgi:hypothetical protein
MMASAVPNMQMLAGDSEKSAAAFNQQVRKYIKTADPTLRDIVQ